MISYKFLLVKGKVFVADGKQKILQWSEAPIPLELKHSAEFTEFDCTELHYVAVGGRNFAENLVKIH